MYLSGQTHCWRPEIYYAHPGIFTTQRQNGFAAFFALDINFSKYLMSFLNHDLSFVQDFAHDYGMSPFDSEGADVSLPDGIDRVFAIPIKSEILKNNGCRTVFVNQLKPKQQGDYGNTRIFFLVYMNMSITLLDQAKKGTRQTKLQLIKEIGHTLLTALTEYNEIEANKTRKISCFQVSILPKDHSLRSKISISAFQEHLLEGMQSAFQKGSPSVEVAPPYVFESS